MVLNLTTPYKLPANCVLLPCYIPTSYHSGDWKLYPVGLKNIVVAAEDRTPPLASQDFQLKYLAGESGSIDSEPDQNPAASPPLVVSTGRNSGLRAKNTDYGKKLNLPPDATGEKQPNPTAPPSVRVKIENDLTGKKLLEMKNSYSRKDEEEEKAKGVSTKLKLYEDPWTIRKKLKSVEVRTEEAGGALLIDSATAKAHIMPVLTREEKESLVKNRAVEVCLWDVDTRSGHDLSLVRLKVQFRSKVHHVIGFGGEWNDEFVKRRGLKEGDEVGLCWDRNASRFNFRLIARSSK